MNYGRDDQDWDWPSEDDGQWTKERAKRDGRFDFAAFLGPDSLEDRITEALDGKDAAQRKSGAVRKSPGVERGRHEAPGPVPEDDDEEDELLPETDPEDDDEDGDDDPHTPPTQRFTLDGGPRRTTGIQRPANRDSEPFTQEPAAPPPRQNFPEPPPRPKVVVTEPAHRVYVTPESQYQDQEPSRRRGSGRLVKWLIALLITLVVLVAAIVAVSTLLPPIGGNPAPTPTDYLSGLNPPGAANTPAPTAPPTAPPTVRVTHTVTVTAGSGGSVSPNGTVDVAEGDSATFTILPDEGYELAQLLVDGSNVSVQGTYTFYDVRQDHTIYAVFQAVAAPPPTEAPPTEPPMPTDPPVPTEPPLTEPPAFTDEPIIQLTPEPEAPPPAGETGEDGGEIWQ